MDRGYALQCITTKLTKTMSIIRDNLMTQPNYTPYCGNDKSILDNPSPIGCDNPRTFFNGKQFQCPQCTWVSSFDEEFITKYKTKWKL